MAWGRQPDQNIVRSSLSHAIVYQAVRKPQAFQDPHGYVPPRIQFVFAKVEKAHPGAERERLSKRPPQARNRGRAQVRARPAQPRAAPPVLQDVCHPRRGGRGLRGGPGHGIALHRPDRAGRQAMHLDTSQDPRQDKEGPDTWGV